MEPKRRPSLLDRIATTLDISRRAVLVTVVALLLCLTLPLMSQGLVLRFVVKATNTNSTTLEEVQAATDPDCDVRVAACRRANQARSAQAAVIPDLNEVSTIAAFCGNRYPTLTEVRTCVDREFKARTGYPPPGGGTAPRPTVTTGG